MSKFNKELVDDLAAKLLIKLSDEENKMVLDEFEAIDRHVNKINDIDGIKDAAMMSYALDDFEYNLREDNAEDSVPKDEILQNCDDVIDGEVSVPKVVG